MMKYVTSVFLVALATCHAVTEQINEEGRVTGGQAAALGQFPWQAVIHHRDVYRCLGVIISDRIILTIREDACVREEEVLSGGTYLHVGALVAANATYRYRVRNFIPDEDPAGVLVGLETQERIDITPDVRAVKVLQTQLRDGTLAQSSGWGYDNERIVLGLQFVDLNVTHVGTSIVSADLHPKHACKWDRGSGLVITDPNTLLRMLAGIAELNEGACDPTVEEVSKYIPMSEHVPFVNYLLSRP